ncbi:MAG: hypothetical protein GY869_18495, partial [Planctomycetes bacterium]|nr:hypothetical protein [Planctomycetota bacterium]
MIRSRFQSTTTSIAILAAFLLFSPDFGHTVSKSLQETPTETPTATPTAAPTSIPHLVKIQTVDISSKSIGAVHPQTGDLYLGTTGQYIIYHPSSSGLLSQSNI